MSELNPLATRLISICIPTYNRAEKVFELVQEILTYKGDEIEVIVLDNCSNDQTHLLLDSIKDDRFVYIRNEQDIGGPFNHLKVLTYSSALYAFLCLDKDRLDYRNLPDLINRIKALDEVTFGYCGLNLVKESDDVTYEQGYESLINMAYLSNHPTGMFYKSKIFSNLDKLIQIFNDGKKFGFYPDILNGEMALTGKSKIINLPLFYTESREECAKVQSFTYNDKDIFFAPAQRFTEFYFYVDSVRQLNITRDQLFNTIKKLYVKCLLASTFGYRSIMNDQEVCEHYGMSTRKVGFIEILKIEFYFSSRFICKKLPISNFKKLQLYLFGHFRFLLNLIMS